MIKRKIMDYVESIREELIQMSDSIFDNPETAYEEFKTSAAICAFFERHGFAVERGAGGLETAFRAQYQNGWGGPVIGLICEYDALPVIGHACGHHTEGSCVGAVAVAVKELLKDFPYTIVVYGAPAEEVGSGKIDMLHNGCFQELDVVITMHMDTQTSVDVKAMAMQRYLATFHGKAAHAAIKPEAGRSALDAMLLSFQGIEFMREHCMDDVRMHYTVVDAGGAANVVPAKAAGRYILRSYNTAYLEDVVRRFKQVVQGAAMMADCSYELELEQAVKGKIPVYKLNQAIMHNAEFVGARQLSSPREKTGSNDVGDVMHEIPGACMRIAFLPRESGAVSHSQAYLDAGKSPEAHQAIIKCAQTLACTAYDLITQPDLLTEIQEEFRRNKEKEGQGL